MNPSFPRDRFPFLFGVHLSPAIFKPSHSPAGFSPVFKCVTAVTETVLTFSLEEARTGHRAKAV